MKRVLGAISLVAITLFALPPVTADAREGNCDAQWVTCGTDYGGAYVGWKSRDQVMNLPKFPGDKGGSVVAADKKRPVYEYRTLADCYQAKPGSSSEGVSCMTACNYSRPRVACG